MIAALPLVLAVSGGPHGESRTPCRSGADHPAVERGVVHVAVAANFATVHEQLAKQFEAGTGHRIVSSIGSTGQLYAQILNGAPFEILLAADTARPARLEQAGRIVEGSRFTYAVGRLALLASSRRPLYSIESALREESNRRIAIANPATAPYGEAAEQVMERLGVTAAVRMRIVRGENIAQTRQFVATGAAELGIVAWSQVIADPDATFLLVPDSLHGRIAQDAVLLLSAARNPAALAYYEFLRGDVAARLIRSNGYDAR